MKKISILGSTGSIGVNALKVIENELSRFRVVGLAAGRNIKRLKEQIERFRPRVVSVLDENYALELRSILNPALGTEILFGNDGYCEVAILAEADLVLSSMVGAAGLLPTIAAIDAGKDIALANKETMVMAGSLVMAMAREKGVKILPVDSEHSAIFQCIAGHRPADIKRLILTASGGPFRQFSPERLACVTPEDALKHPNWQMGRKITIDSATMMNKGLEVIEARWLFDVDFDRIDVLIHPRSIVHSLVEYRDGAVMAQLGLPDMKIPIAYALSYPERMSASGPALDLIQAGALEFFSPEEAKFPLLNLAYKAGRAGGTAPAVLNAVNEAAVEAFLNRDISFLDIPKIAGSLLKEHVLKAEPNLGDILQADRWGRAEAKNMIERIKNC
jgi:1-deoxy-D-xylulose-5-phosphate reductoisomerase